MWRNWGEKSGLWGIGEECYLEECGTSISEGRY